jgi:hypothetical protein
MTNVQHNFSVVNVSGGEAEIADQYRDSSVFVDPKHISRYPAK